MFNKLIQFVIGKNLPTFGRAVSTFIGSLLLASVVFDPSGVPLDPALADAAIEIPVPGEAEIKDGITLGELFRVLAGLILIGASRLMSFFRAKNLTPVANVFGAIVGRSMSSLMRALATGTSAILAFFTGNPQAAPDVISNMPLATFIGAILAWAFARFNSATQDAKLNPVRSSDIGKLFDNRDIDMTGGGFLIALCMIPLFTLTSCGTIRDLKNYEQLEPMSIELFGDPNFFEVTK